jgi:HPt (histidine-containing phosphotransfer) domain-containing protein
MTTAMHEDESRQDRHQDRGDAARSAFSDDPEMRALLAFFLEDLDRRVGSLRRALDAADLAGLRSLAHQLSGTAGGYGFPAIGDAAREVEAGLPARRPSSRVGRSSQSDFSSSDFSKSDFSSPPSSASVGAEDDAIRELAEEAALSAVSERAETLITLCQDAVRAGRREGFAWGLTGELAPYGEDGGEDDRDGDGTGAAFSDADPFGFERHGRAPHPPREPDSGDEGEDAPR